MILLDANYILRFLLKDNLEMYNISKECIVNNNCTISSEVLAEVVFVLLKVYKVEKEDISKSLVDILRHDSIVMNDKNTIIKSLEIFENKNLDFVDCILCAKSKRYTVKTFDKKLNKCIGNI
ncbi:MAG: PIN domain-containing protein [Campylobacterota bacterium]|nr:PIN domain-containing protein [Campylobacterota bacterium]